MKRYVQLFENFTSQLTPEEQAVLDYVSTHVVTKFIEQYGFVPTYRFEGALSPHNKTVISFQLGAQDVLITARKTRTIEALQRLASKRTEVAYIHIDGDGIRWGYRYPDPAHPYEKFNQAAGYPILNRKNHVCDTAYFDRALSLLASNFGDIQDAISHQGFKLKKLTDDEWNSRRIDRNTSDTINNLW